MDLLLTKTPKEAVQFHVLPMVFQALEAPSDQVQVRMILKIRKIVFKTSTTLFSQQIRTYMRQIV